MTQSNDQLILVDEQDNPIGTAPKLAAHQQALLHRAFSIFVVYPTDNGYETLLQQRQHDKYHSGGLWTNSCCGHPLQGENTLEAGKKRLYEEMGIRMDLTEIGHFTYREKVNNELTEHEYDHVFLGVAHQKNVSVNKVEVADYRWMGLDEVFADYDKNPQRYTVWFKPALDILLTKLPF